MNCMKCGREIEEDQVFCGFCLTDMEKYPVKPGIAIQLPKHREPSAIRKPVTKRRQLPSNEEKILILKKRIRRLVALWLITLLLLAATAYPTFRFFQDMTKELPGQNYSTITDSSDTQP